MHPRASTSASRETRGSGHERATLVALRRKLITYSVEGWGIGELLFAGSMLVYHELPRVRVPARPPAVLPLVDRLRAYFDGESVSFDDLALDLSWATPFQRTIARTLQGVPAGEVVTYGELAALAGHPNAQRAVGSFCAGNRYAVIIPCHRVVASTGLGSYGSLGTEYKRRLLALEGVEL